MDKKLISTKKASKILGVSVSTVSRWFDQGILTGIKNPLTSWRKIDTTSIETLLKSCNIPIPEEPKKEEEKPTLGVDEKHDTNVCSTSI